MNTSWKINKDVIATYLALSEKSAEQDMFFDKFRIIPQLEAVRGYTPIGFQEQCRKDILKYEPELLKNIEKYENIDKFGRPNLYGGLSGDTWKSLQTASILKKYIGNINGDVIEFGSNYGNLTYILLTLFNNITEYYMIDFDEVQLLSKKVLQKSLKKELFDKIKFQSPPSESTLYIAEYSLTEQINVLELIEGIKSQWIWIRNNIQSYDLHFQFIKKLKMKYDLLFIENEKPQYRNGNVMILGRLKLITH